MPRSGFWWVLVGSGRFWELRLPCPAPQENHKLRDQNDDLNGQILSLSLYETKNLFATQTKAQSLAAEIDTASRDEVTCPVLLALEPRPLVCESCPAPMCGDDKPQAAPSGKSRPEP